jgi:hypothetical protein
MPQSTVWIEYTLEVASFEVYHAVKIGTDKQATLQPSRPYLTLSASGPKGLCVLISYAMRDSCEYLMDHLDVC